MNTHSNLWIQTYIYFNFFEFHDFSQMRANNMFVPGNWSEPSVFSIDASGKSQRVQIFFMLIIWIF